MRFAVIQNGTVVNVVVANAPLAGLTMVESAEARIGDTYDGEIFITPPPLPPSERAYIDAVQRHLDEGAQARGYDGILSAASYASSPHPRFGGEGLAFLSWRDAVWDYCYGVLADVQAEQRAAPAIDELLAELPVANLPSS